ncbi:MAG: sigma 54-interacting transcriptional regulator [Bacteroidota bacterium]
MLKFKQIQAKSSIKQLFELLSTLVEQTYIYNQMDILLFHSEDTNHDHVEALQLLNVSNNNIKQNRVNISYETLTEIFHPGRAYGHNLFYHHTNTNNSKKATLSFSVKVNNDINGIFNLHSNSPNAFRGLDADALSHIAPYLSAWLELIIRNEELSSIEQEKSFHLKIVNTFSSHEDWNKKFYHVARLLHQNIPMDFGVFVVITQDKHNDRSYRFMEQSGSLKPVSDHEFCGMINVPEERFMNLRSAFNHLEPAIFQGVDLSSFKNQFGIVDLTCTNLGLNSCLVVPISLSRDSFFVTLLLSREDKAYNNSHLNTLIKLNSSLSLSLEKLLAYEEIERLNNQLEHERSFLADEIKTNYNFEEIIGESPKLQRVFHKVSQVAPTDSTVLIQGETGTGKELVARAIHNLSSRQNRSLIKVNCATLSPQLLESELFGHEKGSFTGAIERRLGKFELANHSTIFLDEIGELSQELQSKLLRVLQEKEFERVGGNKVIKSDVRIIAATNRNLEYEINNGNFRSDLYFRLNVFPVIVPSLRERREDIPLLANHFLKRSAKKLGKRINSIHDLTLQEFLKYDWPGNVRELEHIIERASIINKGSVLQVALEKLTNNTLNGNGNGHNHFQVKTIQQAEKELIINTLKVSGGRIRGMGGAAELLDIKPSTLESRMKKLGIKRRYVLESIDS